MSYNYLPTTNQTHSLNFRVVSGDIPVNHRDNKIYIKYIDSTGAIVSIPKTDADGSSVLPIVGPDTSGVTIYLEKIDRPSFNFSLTLIMEDNYSYRYDASYVGEQIYYEHDCVLTTTSTVNISEITGLQDALDLKADVGHNHAIEEVVGLQTELDGKAPVGHSHELDELLDVDATSPNLDDILLFNGVNWESSNRLVIAEGDITGIEGDVAVNTANIGANVTVIAANTSNIALNTATLVNKADLVHQHNILTDMLDFIPEPVVLYPDLENPSTFTNGVATTERFKSGLIVPLTDGVPQTGWSSIDENTDVVTPNVTSAIGANTVNNVQLDGSGSYYGFYNGVDNKTQTLLANPIALNSDWSCYFVLRDLGSLVLNRPLCGFSDLTGVTVTNSYRNLEIYVNSTGILEVLLRSDGVNVQILNTFEDLTTYTDNDYLVFGMTSVSGTVKVWINDPDIVRVSGTYNYASPFLLTDRLYAGGRADFGGFNSRFGLSEYGIQNTTYSDVDMGRMMWGLNDKFRGNTRPAMLDGQTLVYDQTDGVFKADYGEFKQLSDVNILDGTPSGAFPLYDQTTGNVNFAYGLFGYVGMQGNVTQTIPTGVDIWTDVLGVNTTLISPSNVFVNNRGLGVENLFLYYVASQTYYFKIGMCLSFTKPNNSLCEFAIAKSSGQGTGTVMPETVVSKAVGSSAEGSLAWDFVTQISQNDGFKLITRNRTNTGAITIKDVSITIQMML